MLNPNAMEFTPGGPAGAVGTKPIAIALPIRVRAAGTCGYVEDNHAGQAPPNGLAELAHAISGDMAFEDVFGHDSRQNSVRMWRLGQGFACGVC
jgi:hypothetical protein